MTESVLSEVQGESNGAQGQNANSTAMDMEDNFAAIRTDIKMMATEMKSELRNFRDVRDV